VYQHRRVSQNIEIEEKHSAATAALQKLREFNDSLGLTLGQKIVLTAIGFSAFTGLALWFVARYFR